MANTKLHTTNEKMSISLLQYNVDQAMREEAVEETKWENRRDRINLLIREVNADIVCIQEMRELPNSQHPLVFLANFAPKYRFEVAFRNPSTLSFGQAILYNPMKFFPLRVEKKWLSDTPDVVSDTWAIKTGGTTGFGYIVQGVQFVHVRDGKVVANVKPFWVFNVHFGLEEDLKTKSCVKLLEIVERLSGGESFIVCGDFNFFPDRDGNTQRAILSEQWVDHGRVMTTLKGKQIEGTFIGYDHDLFKADLNNVHSRLDHIFTSNDFKSSGITLYTKTMLEQEPDELTTRKYPSDHLPLLTQLRFN